MGFLNEYFDAIYCINLKRRNDRWEEVQSEFERWDINVERSIAVDGKHLMPHEDQIISTNEMGCSKSHLALLQKMVDNNWEKILVFEDDIYFSRDPHEAVKLIVEHLPVQWDMIYLGGNQVRPLLKSGPIWKCSRTFTTSAYGITLEFAKSILEKWKPNARQIDVVYADTHLRGNSFSISPGCCGQRAGYSDIQKAHVDYTKFL